MRWGQHSISVYSYFIHVLYIIVKLTVHFWDTFFLYNLCGYVTVNCVIYVNFIMWCQKSLIAIFMSLVLFKIWPPHKMVHNSFFLNNVEKMYTIYDINTSPCT
jgi:hypothetical protein